MIIKYNCTIIHCYIGLTESAKTEPNYWRCDPFKQVTSTSAAETRYGSILAAGLLSSK